MKKLIPYLILLLCATPAVRAQVRASHLGSFDNQKLHWGIQVGYTQSKFDLHYSEDETLRQTIMGVTSYYSPGFHINIIGSCLALRSSAARWLTVGRRNILPHIGNMT